MATLPAQIGTTTLIARLEQMVLGAEPGLATPGTWRAYIEPVEAFQVSLPPSNIALAPRIVFGPGSPVSFAFDSTTGELLRAPGVAGVQLPVVLWSPGTDADGNPTQVPATGQDWVLTLVQEDEDAAPRVWGSWLFSLSYLDAGQVRDLALVGVPSPTPAQSPEFVKQVKSALAAYFTSHPAGPPGPGGSNADVATYVEAEGPTRQALFNTIVAVTGEQIPELVAAGIDSPANALAPTAWVGLTEPRVIGLGGKVYVGTTGDANELYIEEYSEREANGPLWHRRYFIGYAPNSVTKDDHNNPAVIIRPGKPALTIYSGHSEDNVLRWKKSAVNIEQGIQLGEERRLELAVTDRTAYANCHVHGNNIWVFHRTGNLANFWALSKSTDWGESFTHVGKIISAPKQFYVSGAVSGDVLRIVSAGHPTIADDHNLYYAEINLVTGSITKSDGTVLGNLDGTNLPIAQTSMELIATPASGQVISEAIVSNTPNRQIAYTMANPGSIGSTGRYYYAVKAGSSWTINPVRYVGDQGTGASWGAAHFPTAPVTPSVLYLTRKSGSTWQILRVTTSDNGATWAEEVIESAPITTTQALPIDSLDGTTLGIKALANQIRSYAAYTNWDGSVRPFPTTRPVSRWQPLGDTADRPQPLAYSRVGLYLPGTAGNYITTPDTPALSPSDGIRFMVDAALDDWSNGAQQALVARYGFGGARSVKFFMNGDGKPGVSWSADGTAAADLIPGTILPFADGERWQVRCDLVPAFNATNYLVKFWYRRPGERAWRNHSTTSVSSTVRGIFDSSDPWEIGSRAGGTTDRVKGTIFTAAIQTIGGTVLAEYRADSGTAKYRDSKGSIFTINGSDSAFTATA